MSNTISVLIPTYKRPEKLKRAIESVLAQTYTDLKVIVCDNASGDETAAVVDAIMQTDSRVEYFQHAQNIGMNGNFNFAISKVETPFFTLLPDDDYQLPNYLQDAMQGFEICPDVMFSILEAPVINEGQEENILNRQLAKWPKEGRYLPGEALKLVSTGRHFVFTASVFKQELKSEMYFDEIVGNISDWPIMIALVAKYPFYLSKKAGLYFIRHPQAIGANQNRDHFFRLEEVVRKKLCRDVNQANTALAYLEHNLNKFYLVYLLNRLRMNDEAGYSRVLKEIEKRRISVYKLVAMWVNWIVYIPGVKFCLRKCINSAVFIRNIIKS